MLIRSNYTNFQQYPLPFMEKLEKQQRLDRLLEAIVLEYIKTAKPVGSQTLVEEYGFDYSAATIRNDMAALEQHGYISQPHTSAGRVPTEQGYQYYIQHLLHRRELGQQQKQALAQATQHEQHHRERRIKQLAQTIAELSGETVVISVSGDDYYYTGIAQLFRKPEFTEQIDMLARIGDVFDHLDEVMAQVQRQLRNEVEVLIGQENPVSDQCSMVVTEYGDAQGPAPRGMVSIIGPMRMDYDTNIAILRYIESIMNHHYDR